MRMGSRIRRGIALRKCYGWVLVKSAIITDTRHRYFCNPNFKSHIEALPGTYATEADKKYEGIQSGQYLVQRLTATY